MGTYAGMAYDKSSGCEESKSEYISCKHGFIGSDDTDKLDDLACKFELSAAAVKGLLDRTPAEATNIGAVTGVVPICKRGTINFLLSLCFKFIIWPDKLATGALVLHILVLSTRDALTKDEARKNPLPTLAAEIVPRCTRASEVSWARFKAACVASSMFCLTLAMIAIVAGFRVMVDPTVLRRNSETMLESVNRSS